MADALSSWRDCKSGKSKSRNSGNSGTKLYYACFFLLFLPSLIFLVATNFEILLLARFFLVFTLVGSSIDACAPCGCNVPRLELKHCVVDLTRMIDRYDGPPTSNSAILFSNMTYARMSTSECTDASRVLSEAGAQKGPRVKDGTGTPWTTVFHLFSRADMYPDKDLPSWQLSALRSIIATQPMDRTQIIMWSPDSTHPYPPALMRLIEEAPPNSVTYRVFDGVSESVGTPFEGSALLSLRDSQAYTDSDIFRLLVLYKYGGVYMDLDLLLFRDITPFLDFEWATEFSADGKAGAGVLFNNAIVRFKAGSPAISELSYLALEKTMPRLRSWAYGPHLLDRAYGEPLLGMKAGRVSGKLFELMPWCFFHGMWSVGDVHSSEREIGDEHVMGTAPWDKSPVMAGAWGLHLHGLPRSRKAEKGSIFSVMEERLTERARQEGIKWANHRALYSVH